MWTALAFAVWMGLAAFMSVDGIKGFWSNYERSDGYATVGQVGNEDHGAISLGKAGRSRWMGRRPHVRGVAMNPHDHPHGGGEGKSGQGNPHPVSPWGQLAKGFKTRKKRKLSDRYIVKRRN